MEYLDIENSYQVASKNLNFCSCRPCLVLILNTQTFTWQLKTTPEWISSILEISTSGHPVAEKSSDWCPGIAKNYGQSKKGRIFLSCCYPGKWTGLAIGMSRTFSLCRRGQQGSSQYLSVSSYRTIILQHRFSPPSFFCVCGICVVAAVKEGHYNPALHLNHGQFYTCCAQLNTSMSTCKTSCCNVLLLKDICILHQCLRPVFALFLCQVANVLEALPFFV